MSLIHIVLIEDSTTNRLLIKSMFDEDGRFSVKEFDKGKDGKKYNIKGFLQLQK